MLLRLNVFEWHLRSISFAPGKLRDSIRRGIRVNHRINFLFHDVAEARAYGTLGGCCKVLVHLIFGGTGDQQSNLLIIYVTSSSGLDCLLDKRFMWLHIGFMFIP